MDLGKELKSLLKENFNSVYFNLTDNEIAGLHELLKLPFYHGMTEEICELKFV